jgi:hypothetical protein
VRFVDGFLELHVDRGLIMSRRAQVGGVGCPEFNSDILQQRRKLANLPRTVSRRVNVCDVAGSNRETLIQPAYVGRQQLEY